MGAKYGHISDCPTDWRVVGLFQHSGINSSDAEVLTLFNVTEAQSGEYVCKVSNYIGEANQSAWLTVTRPVAKGNGEMDGALCWEFDFSPRLLGQVGKPAPDSPCYPAVFLAQSHGKIPGLGGWFGLVLCWCRLPLCLVCVPRLCVHSQGQSCCIIIVQTRGLSGGYEGTRLSLANHHPQAVCTGVCVCACVRACV